MIKLKSIPYPELDVTLCDMCMSDDLVLQHDYDLYSSYTVGPCDICSGKTSPVEAH